MKLTISVLITLRNYVFLSYVYMWDTIHYNHINDFPLQTFGLIVSKETPTRTFVVDVINHLATCKK